MGKNATSKLAAFLQERIEESVVQLGKAGRPCVQGAPTSDKRARGNWISSLGQIKLQNLPSGDIILNFDIFLATNIL